MTRRFPAALLSAVLARRLSLDLTGLAPATSTDEPELAAWTSLCRVMLNLHETITRY